MSLYYEDEYVQLHHGDCRQVTEWLDADVLVTDPPYGMAYAARGTYDSKTGKTHQPKGAKRVANDDSTVARDAALDMWGDKPAIVFGTWRQERPENTRHRLIWWKRGQAPGPANSAFMLQDEEIYVLGDGWVRSSPPMRSVIATSEARSNEVGKIGHPTPKPIGLMEVLLERCPPGVIADPFAGSGSTLIAARNLGRKAIGVEIDKSYCEIIAARLSQQAFDFSALEEGVA